jgi:4-amino-4-deoxy-L-arabinose transferase-like glycosyltransferase
MSESPTRFRNTAWTVFACALAIRLVGVWAASGAELVLDEIAYVARAEALLDGRGYLGSYQSWVRHPGWKIMELPQYPGAYQPPGYPTFVAAVMAICGRSLLAVQLAQCLLSAASCVLLLALGRSWFGERAGRLAAWMCAFYPNLVAYSHLLWSETLYVFELLCLLWLLFGSGPDRLPSPRRAALAGVVLGAAALTRGTTVYLVPVLAFWLWLLADGSRGWPRRPRAAPGPALARAAVVVGVALAAIAPWSVRSSLLHGGFVLIDTNGPYNLWRGNAPGALLAHTLPGVPRYSWPFESLPLHPVASLDGRALVESFRRDRPYTDPTDLAIADYASDAAWAAIVADPPRAVRAAWIKLGDMWNPTSFVLRHFELGAYGDVPAAVRLGVSVAVVASYLAVCVLAAIGVGTHHDDRRVWLVVALVTCFSAISMVAFGLTRFRLPLMPLLMLLAALPLVRRRERGAPAAVAPAAVAQ